jgi:DNA-binding SARP family transcriptional activator
MARLKTAKKTDHPDKLSIRTFGGLSIYYQGSPISILWESQKARLLFCYLVITADQWVHRDRFIELLWPGCTGSAGANNFKTTLSRLRKSFSGSRVINPVMAQGEAVRINIHDIEVDVSRFRQNAVAGIKLHSRGETKPAREYLELAQEIYRGEFLPEEPFNEFISNTRKELAELESSVEMYLERIYRQEGDSKALEAFQILKRRILSHPV